MEILNSHAQAIESQAPQRFQVRARSHPRIDFDAYFRVGCERKARTNSSEQVLDLFRCQIRGRSAAPMKLHDLALFRNASADPLHLALQHAEIRRSDTLILLNDYIARAKQAEALAKR